MSLASVNVCIVEFPPIVARGYFVACMLSLGTKTDRLPASLSYCSASSDLPEIKVIADYLKPEGYKCSYAGK